MRSLRGVILAAWLVAALGCGRDGAPAADASPDTLVADLFDLAREDDPDPARIARLFGTVDDERAGAALHDAIRALRATRAPEIVETYTLDDLQRTGFDLQGVLEGGGVAHYSVLLDTTTPPGRIVWFSGPDVEWPERKDRGPGISTSASPADFG